VVSLKHDPEKWEPVFGKRSCSNKDVERDDDSKKHHPALHFKRDVRRPDAQKQQAECSDPGGIEKMRHEDMMPDKSKFASA